MNYEIQKSSKQTWAIEDKGVRSFLLTGPEIGLLIDSGMTTENSMCVFTGTSYKY